MKGTTQIRELIEKTGILIVVSKKREIKPATVNIRGNLQKIGLYSTQMRIETNMKNPDSRHNASPFQSMKNNLYGTISSILLS